jgi:hypothetical protein
MKRKIRPAPPVATDPRIRVLEISHREKIAELKETDPDRGREKSASATLMIKELDPDVIRGMKVKTGASQGHEKTHGTKEEQADRHENIRRTYQQFKTENPGWIEKQIEHATAEILGVGVRSVQRHKNKK